MILHNRKLGQKKIQNKTGPIAKKERKKKKNEGDSRFPGGGYLKAANRLGSWRRRLAIFANRPAG
jgi:hypothetical protein